MRSIGEAFALLVPLEIKALESLTDLVASGSNWELRFLNLFQHVSRKLEEYLETEWCGIPTALGSDPGRDLEFS